MSDAAVLAEAAAIYLDASVFPKIDIEGGNSPESRLVRLLICGSRVPVFASLVALGEFFKVAGSKSKHAEIETTGYLYSCRALLKDFEIRKLRTIEPPDERFAFLQLAYQLVARHGGLGGGDVWHLMAALQLKGNYDPVAVLSFDRKLAQAATAEGLTGVFGNGVDPDLVVSELTARGRWVAA